MAFSKAQIINKGMVKIGARPIVNIETDDTQESVIALNIYDIALEGILSDIMWTFATKRKLLATLDESVAFDREFESLSHVYERPTDCIRIFGVNDTGATYYEEDGKILSDTAGLGVIYAFRNTDPATYSAAFVNAFADLLGAEFAYPLLNSASKASDMMSFYENVSLPRAESQNSQIGTALEMNDNFWINSRFGGPNVRELS